MSFAPAAALMAGSESDRRAGDELPLPGAFDGDRLLVPVLTSARPALTDQVRVASALARTTDATLHVVHPGAQSGSTTVDLGRELTTDDERDLLDWATDRDDAVAPTNAGFLSARRLVNDLLDAIRRHDIDTLVVPSDPGTGPLRPGVTDRLALRATCDVVTVNGRRGYRDVPSILLAVAGGPHSGLATDVAGQIAADCDAWVDVLHVVEEGSTDRERQAAECHVETAARRIDRPSSTTTWVLEAPDVAAAIIEQSTYYGLTVIGAPTKGRLRQFISGSTNQTIRSDARSVVLSVRNNEQ